MKKVGCHSAESGSRLENSAYIAESQRSEAGQMVAWQGGHCHHLLETRTVDVQCSGH